MNTYSNQETEEAMRLAGLWNAGKMIGGDTDVVCMLLYAEVLRLQEQQGALVGILKRAVGGVVYLSEAAGVNQREWRVWDKEARATLAKVCLDENSETLTDG